MKSIVVILGFLFFIFSSTSIVKSSHIQNPQTGIWLAPASADDLVNPLVGDAAATTAGKALYTKYCVVCHGPLGKGNGVAAAGLQIPPADHSSVKVQSQTDGAIFWKITNGRGAMASYKTTLTETQRWQLVNYIRTLAKSK